VLGILLGVGVVTAFVFLGSEDTIDAPRISGADGPAAGPAPAQPPVPPAPVVRVVNGGPPPAGPVLLRFRRDQQVRFRVLTDSPIVVEVPEYGVSERVAQRRTLSFRANRIGRFGVIVAASGTSIAELRISRGAAAGRESR
jgi:hypothetical protein